MSETRPPLDPELARYVDAAKRQTHRELDPSALALLLPTRAPRRRALLPLILATSGALALAALVVVLLRDPPAAPRPDASAQLLLKSGDVEVTYASGAAGGAENLSGAEVRVGERGKLVAHLGRARLAASGRARLRLGPRPKLDEGVAAFDVERRAGDEAWRLSAGRSEVTVHGTRFVLEVKEGELRSASVASGVVEVVSPGAPPRTLRAGERLEATTGASANPDGLYELLGEATLASSAGGPAGYLAITSEPAGATITVDGVALGETPAQVRLAPTTHDLTLALTGHTPHTARASVPAEGRERLHVVLEPLEEEEPEVATPAAASTQDVVVLAQKHLRTTRCKAIGQLAQERGRARDDTRARLLLLLGECHLRRHEPKAALAAYRRVTAEHADDASAEPALFEQAKLSMQLGKHDEALALLDQFLSRFPKSALLPAAHFRRCEALLARGRLVEARLCLEGFQARHPTAPRAVEAELLLGHLERRAGRLAEAVRHYRSFLAGADASPLREEAQGELALTLHEVKSPEGPAAVREYLERYPNGPHAAQLRSLTPSP